MVGLEVWLNELTSVPLPQLLIGLASATVPLPMAAMGYGHYRGNFHRWPMHLPVIVPPLFAVTGFLALVLAAEWMLWVHAVASVTLLLMGLAGSFFHVQGSARQTGGFNVDNIMVGPPLFAPLTFAGLALLALLGLAYRMGSP